MEIDVIHTSLCLSVILHVLQELQKLVSDERNLKEKLNEDLHQQKSQASALQTEQIQNVEVRINF